MRTRAQVSVQAVLLLAVACRTEPSRQPSAGAPDAAVAARAAAVADARPASTGRGEFFGRPIAQTCSHLGAAWLDRREREASEQPEAVLDALGIVPGMVVADVGAGTGYFTLRLARRVGPKGRVIATDVQPQMIATVRERVAAARLENVETRVVTDTEAGLPVGKLDLVLLVDVYHELGDPAATMKQVRAALAEGGRLVLVEYRGEDPSVPIRPEHKMTLAQVRRELEPMGFRFVESLEFLPVQRIVVFVRDDAPGSPSAPSR